MRPTRALLAVYAAIAVACGSPGGSRSRDSTGAKTPTCIATSESAAFACSNGTVSRAGDTLRIRLATGRTKQLVNTGGESDLTYQYVGRLGPQAYHLVEQFGGERSPYFWLVHPRSGLMVMARGMPVMSPDSMRFAAATPEWDCAESPDQRLAIWRFADSLPVREWEVAPRPCETTDATSGWAALAPVWRTSDTLAFVKVTQPSNRRRSGLVVWDGRAWHLTDSLP